MSRRPDLGRNSKSAAAAEGYGFHPLAGDLGTVLTSTGRTSTRGGLDRRPGHRPGTTRVRCTRQKGDPEP